MQKRGILYWAGKAEHTSFDIQTVSLHVHERIDPRTIIEAMRKRNGDGKQMSLFEYTEENRRCIGLRIFNITTWYGS